MYNVLIVDDDTLMRNALRAMISRFKNFQIIGEAANGAEAIAICRLYPVHLIFMDIIMPGLNGMDGARQMREIDPETKIVFVTNMAQYAVQGYEVDALDFVVKPVNYKDFSYCNALFPKKDYTRV